VRPSPEDRLAGEVEFYLDGITWEP
jgi:hypothetical protein